MHKVLWIVLAAVAWAPVGLMTCAALAGEGAAAAAPRATLAAGAPEAEKLGWRLGCQAYSFNRFTFFEAVDKNASLGLKVIEGYPGQKISKEMPVGIGPGMDEKATQAVKDKLASAGVKMVCFGVTGIPGDEAGMRKLFDWCKSMGIETIVTEADRKTLQAADKFCQEYGINIALHNHPRPSRYWDPDTVLKACEGLSSRIGACADTGHWMRSGLDPVECLKKLKGRIISLHFKDLSEAKGGHDVPWGQGKGNAKAMLKELCDQGFKGVFSAEYEHNWDNSVPDIAKCVEFFNQTAGELARQKASGPAGG